MPSMMSRGPSSQGRLMHSTRSALVSLTNGAASNGDDNKSNTNGGGGGHAPAEISIEEYHERADAFMNELVAKLEDMQDRKDDMDVEYTVRGLTHTSTPFQAISQPGKANLSTLLTNHNHNNNNNRPVF